MASSRQPSCIGSIFRFPDARWAKINMTDELVCFK